MARVLLNIPRSAARGSVVAIRTLIQHPMESGYRPGADGEVVPRDILRRYTCTYEARWCSAPSCRPPSRPIPFCPSPWSPPAAARSCCAGRRQRLQPERDAADRGDMTRRLLALLLLLGVSTAAQERRSGFDDMARETQAMQRDDDSNPGMLWVLEGEALWQRSAGPQGRSCAGCHGDAEVAMRGWPPLSELN
jgi:hypothetical protein